MLDRETNPIRPLTVSEILDNTFKIYGRNFLAIILFSLLISGVFSLVSTYLVQGAIPGDLSTTPWEDIFNDPENLADILNDPENLPDIDPGALDSMMDNFLKLQIKFLIISLIGAIFITPFVQGGIVNVAYWDFLGYKIPPGKAFSSGLKNFGRYILTGLSLILYAIWMVIGLIIVSLIILIPLGLWGGGLISDPTGGRIVGFSLLVLLSVVLIAVLALSARTFIIFAYQATMEGKCGFKAIGRSFSLTSKQFGRVLGINLLLYIIVGIMVGILAMISGVTSILSPSPFMSSYAMGFIVSGFVTPILYIATTLLFFDTKARVEGPGEGLR